MLSYAYNRSLKSVLLIGSKNQTNVKGERYGTEKTDPAAERSIWTLPE